VIAARDTALLLEGGGMRAAYSAGVVDVLMARGVEFGWVGGISAGASHMVSYLSGERDRLRSNFVDFAAEREFGGWSHLLRGRGYFNAEYIYGKAPALNLPRPFEADRVLSGDTPFRIGATRADTGESVYWGRRDVEDVGALMLRVRASSSIPLAMPIPTVDGVPYADGAFGSSGGVPLDAAEADGFERFFAVLTHPRGYVKEGVSRPRLTRTVLRRWPALAEATLTRHVRYNATMERLYRLESEGRAVLVFPGDASPLVSSTNRNIPELRRSLSYGVADALHQWPAWEEFLTAGSAAHSSQR
jgi:predicted patatin/cPLA2 family phospholipase